MCLTSLGAALSYDLPQLETMEEWPILMDEVALELLGLGIMLVYTEACLVDCLRPKLSNHCEVNHPNSAETYLLWLAVVNTETED